MMKLDESNSIPLYLQLKNTIKDLINSGEIQKGDRIPSEFELCKKYNVSRITVRNALSELESEGYLIKKQGKGTFVTKPKIFRPLEDTVGFTESCKNAGVDSTSIVLKKEILPLTQQYQNDLQLEKHDKIFNPASYCRADGFHRLFYNRAGDLFYTSDISASEYRYSGDHYTGVCCQYICPRTGKYDCETFAQPVDTGFYIERYSQ